MDFVDRTVRDIRKLKIQGAFKIALAAIKAWETAKDKRKAERKLFASRPTEPMLRNSLAYLKKYGKTKELIAKLKSDQEKIIQYAVGKVPQKGIVYTHCHSSTVNEILKKAKHKGKKFLVTVTETRPFFQGRITAKEMAKAKIPVILFVDSAARLAMKKVDVMLIGADAITAEGVVINKIGSELMSEVANNYKIPIYVCTHSWKFDPQTVLGFEEKIEKRAAKEIWNRHPKGVSISNYVFEKVDPNKITAIISELGVLKPNVFVEEVKKTYGWMFD
jgi:ribose 1,5-bisphosphate isomerase